MEEEVGNTATTSSNTVVWVLVDYANLPMHDRQAGFQYFIHRLLNRIGNRVLPPNSLVRVRLYDGWYDEESLSLLAQRVAAEIADFSPAVVSLSGPERPSRVKVSVALARSLICDPSRELLHTYRRKSYPRNLKCADAPYSDCASEQDCPLAILPQALRSKRCTHDGCSQRLQAVLYRSEQKIVDTMMVADLIELAQQDCAVAIVSSDDDMWPGINQAVAHGKQIVHVHTRPRSPTAEYYESAEGRYISIGTD